MTISVIIPTYNEEKNIIACLQSLSKQSIKDFEIIVVDDGSTDATAAEIQNTKDAIQNLLLLKQKHLGPGAARNLGARKAKGKILVFVDADMEFAPDFLEKLTEPIIQNESIGTFSRDEYLLDKESKYARCWNLNLGRSADLMIGEGEYQNGSPVFRAILKSEFEKAGEFDAVVGYTDDWTISRKLGVLATASPGAKFYHRNPETLADVWTQARWFGKNEFLTGTLIRKFYNLFRYNPIFGALVGIFGIVKFQETAFLPFKIVFNTAVFTSVLLSFLKEGKNK